MQKQDYQEIGDPVTIEVNGEKEENKQEESDKLVQIEEDQGKKEMPDYIAVEAKKADIGFYIIQVIVSLVAGVFATWSGYSNMSTVCSHPVATWLEISGLTIVSIGLLWWVALFALKYIRKNKLRSNLSRGFGAVLVVVGIFFVVWWVMGHVWVFQTSKTDCDEDLYLTGLWFIIGVYIYMVMMMCLQCWVAMCLVCCAVFRRPHEPEQPVDGASEQPLVPENENIQEPSDRPENPENPERTA